MTLAFYFNNSFVRGIGFLFIYSRLQASSIMIWVVTLLRSKVCCSTTTEATSHCLPGPPLATHSPEQSSTTRDLLEPALQSSTCLPSRMAPRREEQHCSRDFPRWMEGGCTDDVAEWTQLAKRVLKSAGRTGETMERLSRERPSRREIPVADHYRTGPSRAVCVSILTIMDITVNPGPSNIPLHC